MGEDLLAYIEIPKGSRNNYEFDAELGTIVLDRSSPGRPSTQPTTAI